MAYSDLLNAIGAFFAARSDLTPTSPILGMLREGTENASKEHRDASAFRARLVFGENDHVVHVGSYNCDHLLPYEKSQSHFGICKPKMSYLRPLEILV